MTQEWEIDDTIPVLDFSTLSTVADIQPSHEDAHVPVRSTFIKVPLIPNVSGSPEYTYSNWREDDGKLDEFEFYSEGKPLGNYDFTPFVNVRMVDGLLQVEVLHYSLLPFVETLGLKSMDKLTDRHVPFDVEDRYFAPSEYSVIINVKGSPEEEAEIEEALGYYPEGVAGRSLTVDGVQYSVRVFYFSY